MSSFKSNVSVPLEPELIKEVDQIAFEQDLSRAGYIRAALKERMDKDRKKG